MFYIFWFSLFALTYDVLHISFYHLNLFYVFILHFTLSILTFAFENLHLSLIFSILCFTLFECHSLHLEIDIKNLVEISLSFKFLCFTYTYLHFTLKLTSKQSKKQTNNFYFTLSVFLVWPITPIKTPKTT